MPNPLLLPERSNLLNTLHQPQTFTYRPEQPTPIRNSPTAGIIALPFRPNTKQDAEFIRVLYRRMYERCIKYTNNRRTCILNAPHTVVDGVPVYRLAGFVVDARFNSKGHLNRICLMDVRVLDSDNNVCALVDTHMWLFINRLKVDKSIIDKNAGLSTDIFTASLGDEISIECTLEAYGETKRLGIAEWKPVSSMLPYGDYKGRTRHVPRHLCAGMEILSITRKKKCKTITEAQWGHMLLHALERQKLAQTADFLPL